jgi:small subunit ribosomal protein S8
METLCNNYSIIKNAILENYLSVFVHKSKLTYSLLDVLYAEGVIRGYNTYSTPGKIEVFLKYHKGHSVINNIKAVSSPGRYVYLSFDDICYWNKQSKHSFIVLSTSKNVISSKVAKQLKVGGKALCIIS